ncbi:DoxX family membrane protein [Pseudalgibacter alginicilyticus]|uniref:DoxX family membrane protein n=1 Tax=Pseudalgibacter alginicilyticus TaxID=1736674 RepID=UPI001F3B8D7C|nr:DoxX family membrane protein [Pseudalgibacter alginicilyticus]
MTFQDIRLEVSYKSVVILRILLSLTFIVAYLCHFFNIEKNVSKIENNEIKFTRKQFGSLEIGVILSGTVILIDGIFLIIGYKSQISAWKLIAVLIPITLTIQV